MGNQLAIVKTIVDLAMEFTAWNGSPLESIDVDSLAGEIDAR